MSPTVFYWTAQGLYLVALGIASSLLWRRRDGVALGLLLAITVTWPWRSTPDVPTGLQAAVQGLGMVVLCLVASRWLRAQSPPAGPKDDTDEDGTGEDGTGEDGTGEDDVTITPPEALTPGSRLTMETLRVSEEKFAKAFRGSPDAITLSTLRDGKFHEVNPSFEDITGYSRDEALGRTSGDLQLWTNPEDRDTLVEAIQTTGQIRNLQTAFRRKDGTTRHCQVAAEVIQLEGEANVLFIVRDITERQRAEEERERFVTELEAKNAELERFTYTVSHDLRSPLVTIQGFLGAMRRDAKKGKVERMAQDMDRIARATNTMQQLLDDLLQLSRIGRVLNPSQDIDMVALCREACELVAGTLNAQGLRVDIQSDLPPAWGDRPRLLEVLQNLLDNAAKFTLENTSQSIEVGWRPGDSSRDDDDRGTPVYFVKDHGIGIPAEYQEKIFGLFERLSTDVQGTGVGLALAKRIVEVHGGRIWVESEGKGHGCTFCFILPSRSEEGAPLENPKI